MRPCQKTPLSSLVWQVVKSFHRPLPATTRPSTHVFRPDRWGRRGRREAAQTPLKTLPERPRLQTPRALCPYRPRCSGDFAPGKIPTVQQNLGQINRFKPSLVRSGAVSGSLILSITNNMIRLITSMLSWQVVSEAVTETEQLPNGTNSGTFHAPTRRKVLVAGAALHLPSIDLQRSPQPHATPLGGTQYKHFATPRR